MAMEKTFDANEAEGRIYAAWEAAGAFRAGANAALKAVGVAMPPWPGDSEASFVGGIWQPSTGDTQAR